MSLNAGEVFVVVGARLDSAAIAKAKTSFDEIKASSDRAQAAADASSAAQRRAMTDYAASAKRGEDATKRLEQSLSRAKDAAILTGKVGALGVAGIATALGGAALAAVGFDSAMRNVNSIAGLSQKQFDALEKQVLRLAPSLGASPKELATGLYDIVSTGFKASDAIKILAVSAKAGKAGLTDTATATDAITSALKAYGIGASGAKGVSDLLFETVDVGKLNFQQLASSIGTVLPTASTLGIPLKQLGAAIATITLNGTDAKTATTQLSSIFTAFQKPTKDLTKVFHDQGYETAAAGLKALGLKGSLDLLRKQVSGGHATWVDFFKDVRALRGAQGLEGTAHAADLFATSTKAMDGATKGAGATQKAFAEQSKSTALQFEKLKAGIDVAAITIGSALLPKLNEGIQALSHWFLQAEKSGDIDRWAQEVSHAVDEVLKEIQHLAPEAQAAFRVLASTVQAALPYVEKLYELFKDAEPAIAGVVHAGAGLAGVLGAGPIIAAAVAFKGLQTAGLGAQAGIGKFATVMAAGNVQIAKATEGGFAAGKITAIGAAAAGSSGKFSTFAKGLASSIGNPNLIAIGAAGIILGIDAIASHVTTLKQDADKAVAAIAQLGDAHIAKQQADLEVQRDARRVTQTQGALGSAAVRVSRAQATVNVSASRGIEDPAAIARLNTALDAQKTKQENARQASLDYQEALQQQAVASGKLDDASKAHDDTLAKVGKHAIDAAHANDALYRSYNVKAPVDIATKSVENFSKTLLDSVNGNNQLTAAQKASAREVANFVKTVGEVPTTAREFNIIVRDQAAKKSTGEIIADLGWLDGKHVASTIGADTEPADAAIQKLNLETANATRARKVHIGADTSGVTAAIGAINRNILHLTSTPFTVKINYATSGAPPNPTGIDRKRAVGGKTDGPEVALIGEDGPEYVVPVGGKHRAAGIELWMAAGKDLGIPGYAKGKKPGKTPGPIKRGLGYDPQALDDQQAAEKKRLDDATGYRDSIKGKEKTELEHLRALQKDFTAARKASGSKNKKTAAAARARAEGLTGQIASATARIGEMNQTLQHQESVVIPAERKRYQAATAAAKIGNDHAKQITLWQDRADTATSAMSLASSQWDAADRKKDQPGRDRAYTAWAAARKERISDLGHVRSLLEDVKKVVGKTDYGTQIAKSLTDTLGDIVAAQDDTAAPGYQEPDTSGPSTSISDYLNPFELTELQQVAYAQAVASTTDDTQDDVNADTVALGVANQIAERLQREGAPIDIVTQAFEAIASAKSDLASAVTANTPTVAGPTADQQAQLDQANARATAAQANADSAASALKVYQQSGDLFRGQGVTINVGVRALTADSPSVQRRVGESVAAAFGAQPSISSSSGTYNG